MKKIVFYGAGRHGRALYNFLKVNQCSEIVYGFCDKRAKEIEQIDNKPVFLFEEIKENKEIVFCISVLDTEIKQEIAKKLSWEGYKTIEFIDISDWLGIDKVKFSRNYCAFHHIIGMDNYFEAAEECLDIFWGQKSEFIELFQKLDITNVIELACGRGRHVSMYVDKAKKITLVDILQKNIDICKERFAKYDQIFYLKNNGYNLQELKSEEYTALFTYDAMVHFELLDIYEYLKDIHRVLKTGGKALFHHSNNGSNYKANFATDPHGRNFMTKEVFAYLANRAGFSVLEQKYPVMLGDCLTLVMKE